MVIGSTVNLGIYYFNSRDSIGRANNTLNETGLRNRQKINLSIAIAAMEKSWEEYHHL